MTDDEKILKTNVELIEMVRSSQRRQKDWPNQMHWMHSILGFWQETIEDAAFERLPPQELKAKAAQALQAAKNFSELEAAKKLPIFLDRKNGTQ
jgi:hypothetical protein